MEAALVGAGAVEVYKDERSFKSHIFKSHFFKITNVDLKYTLNAMKIHASQTNNRDGIQIKTFFFARNCRDE
jgi:hypothetical protein